MLEQIRYTAKWVHYKLQGKFGQRGSEMIEYALLLACVAALAYWFYSTKKGGSNDPYNKLRLTQIMPRIWNKIGKFITTAQGK